MEALLIGVSTIGNALLGNHPDRCSIKGAAAPQGDGEGGYTEGETSIATNLPCSYVEATGKEKIVGNAVVEIGDLVVTLAARLEVPANAVIEVEPRGSTPLLKFQVKAMLRDSFMDLTLVLATESAGDE